MDAAQFANALHKEFNATRHKARKINTAKDWTKYMQPRLTSIAEDGKLWWASSSAGRATNHQVGEGREYLWDFTMYSRDKNALWSVPRVVIEHENAHNFQAFVLDLWKTLLSTAPLRIAIGYRGKRSRRTRHEWVDKVNVLNRVPANGWTCAAGTEDLIALGYDGMSDDDNFEFWCRRDTSSGWLPLQVKY